MYNLIEYKNNFSKRSGNLWQYYRDEPILTNAGVIEYFPGANHGSSLLKFKQKITSQTGANGRKNVKAMVPLKYLRNLWKTL